MEANQYNTIISGVQSTAATACVLGFNATYLELQNLSGIPVYVNFNSTTATTANYALAASTLWAHPVPPLRALGFDSTTTSTEAALSVFALGG